MRRTVLCVSVFLGCMAMFSGVCVSEPCSSASGCKDCVRTAYPDAPWECGTFQRDGYCSCCAFADGSGCILDDTCDYTGSAGAPCEKYGTCPDVRNIAIPNENEIRTETTPLAPEAKVTNEKVKG